MKTLFPVLVLIISLYIGVLLSVLADLISGVRKARQKGESRTSAALRRTIDKLVRYYNALFAMTVIDAMQIAAVVYLRFVESVTLLPVIPLFTLIGAVGEALIELKSIYEKAEQKEQKEYRDAVETIKKLLEHNSFESLKQIIKS
ncbi:MAG: hypothetical protein J1F10_00235 [Muribaculaceae bacterium]|nr:hypothetical protein [Muribaculaceae bacterium]